MYRVFCESYENFLKMIGNDNVRADIAKPFTLIVNTKSYEYEKKHNSVLYQKLSDLIFYMQENVEKYPKFKAFLWTLESRNITGKRYHSATKEELEEQAKLVNSFLKLAYWN